MKPHVFEGKSTAELMAKPGVDRIYNMICVIYMYAVHMGSKQARNEDGNYTN